MTTVGLVACCIFRRLKFYIFSKSENVDQQILHVRMNRFGKILARIHSTGRAARAIRTSTKTFNLTNLPIGWSTILNEDSTTFPKQNASYF